MELWRTVTTRGRPTLSSRASPKKLTFPWAIAAPPSHLAPSLLSLLGLLAVGVCCCWSNDGGSGMRISNRGCRRRPRWNRFGQRSFPRSALVVTQSFALREAMATRTIRLRSWWCDKRRAKARKPGSVVKRRPVSLALTWDRGEPQDPWPGWIQL